MKLVGFIKNYILLIVSILFFIVQFLNRWFSDQLISIFFAYYAFINLILFVIFLILLMTVCTRLQKSKKMVYKVSLLILILCIVLTFAFPYRQIKTKVEFKLFSKERNEVIEMVKNNNLQKDELGNVILPRKYKKTSTSGKVHVYQNDENGVVVGFYIVRGMLSGSVELMYSTGGKKLILENETGHPISKIVKLKDYWYYVVTNY